MGKHLNTIAAGLMLSIHLAWILFVMAGAFVTRGRPRLTALHIASLIWGIVVELGPWPCPLTMAENAFETRAGIVPYSGSFLVHYLDRIVYPNLSVELIVMCGVMVCVLNLAVYGYRFFRFRASRQLEGPR
jgi:Protein of Unknown function (DUF2784)